MRIEKVYLEDILIEDSPYNFRAFLIQEPANPWEQNLPLWPVTVLVDKDDRLHLIDGLRRLRFLKDKGYRTIEALIIKPADGTEAVRYIFTFHTQKILQSTMQRVLFLNFAQSVEASLNEISKLVKLRGYKNLSEEIERIKSLPEAIKRFFHEKNFSYMQILTFLAYPLEILKTLISWKEKLNLTAQVFEDLVPNITEYLQREELSLEEFLEDKKLREILDSDLPLKKKTESLRQYIKSLRFPYLEGINKTIQQEIEELGLPSSVQVLWDRTLEEPWVEVRIKVTNPRDIERLKGIKFVGELTEKLKKVYDIIKHGSSKE